MKTRRYRIDPAPANTAKRVLVLRSCAADMASYDGQFKWPESGPVSCQDWKPAQSCGNGLHGWLWGEGDSSLGDFSEGSKWLVVSVEESLLVDLGGKVKFPAGEVVFCGDRMAAGKYVVDNGGFGRRVISGTATAGYGGTATAGDGGTATAGYGGTIAILHWNGKRYKTKIATVKDEDGDGDLKSSKKYRLDKNGEFVEVD